MFWASHYVVVTFVQCCQHYQYNGLNVGEKEPRLWHNIRAFMTPPRDWDDVKGCQVSSYNEMPSLKCLSTSHCLSWWNKSSQQLVLSFHLAIKQPLKSPNMCCGAVQVRRERNQRTRGPLIDAKLRRGTVIPVSWAWVQVNMHRWSRM